MAAANDDDPALRSAIELLYDEKGPTRKKAALAIAQMALVEIADPRSVPRLLELLDDEVARRNAGYALRALADKGVFEPSPEERARIGDWNAPDACPYCGGRDVMEVLSYIRLPHEESIALPEPKEARPWTYITAHCAKCHHGFPADPSDKDLRCVRCGDVPAQPELRFHYPGMKYRDFNSPAFDRSAFIRGFRFLYWQCKKCLRTWSPVNDHDPAKECPRCGMGTFVPVARGFPSGPIMAASERKEVFVGASIVMGDEPELACTECGHRCREAAKADDNSG